MSSWYLQFSQKTNEKIQLYYYGTWSRIVFVRFLGELKTPKRHFEINWPLKCWYSRTTWYAIPINFGPYLQGRGIWKIWDIDFNLFFTSFNLDFNINKWTNSIGQRFSYDSIRFESEDKYLSLIDELRTSFVFAFSYPQRDWMMVHIKYLKVKFLNWQYLKVKFLIFYDPPISQSDDCLSGMFSVQVF